jgi:2-polyprenyl-3-methyl-5-hydroxy-6-metoxy-1,4-benzoquinol methylase
MNLRKNCLSCKKKFLKEIINLGTHSFADRFIPKDKLNSKDPTYPLILDYCTKCSFIQSRVKTDPKHRYVDIDYSYTSSNSKYSREHWEKFAEFLEKKYHVKNKKILEVGSNDGYLCEILNKKGASCLGVDASKFMTKLSEARKVNSINAIFSFKESLKIKKKFKKFDIIIANNVFNHSDSPSEFLRGISKLLNTDGIYVFEQPDFAIGALTLKFDQIYHEHISYFTYKNIKTFLKNNKFKLIDIKKNDYHGGSLRSVATQNISKKYSQNYNPSNFKKYNKIYNLTFFKKMMNKINKKRSSFLKKIFSLKSKGFIICGIGAGAKANTFLTYYSLNNSLVKFLTDASKFKQNKFTPLTRILIKDDNEIKKHKKIACILLSWNISSLIVKKIKLLNKNIKILHT